MWTPGTWGEQMFKHRRFFSLSAIGLVGRYCASRTHVAGRNNTPGKEGWSGREGQPPGSSEIVV